MFRLLRLAGPRTLLLGCGLIVAFLVLAYLAVSHLPALADWRPYDYLLYISWGKSLREGIPTYKYPLPTVFWIFAPLSFLPPEFAVVWSAAPFGFVLYLLGRRGIPLWLYFPLLEQAAFAQLDGWLIVPLAWVIANRPILAPLGAVLLLTKPTAALFVVAYIVWYWTDRRQWRQLQWFGGLLFIYLLPAFLIDPFWISRFIALMPERATEPNMLPRGASLWAWVWQGGYAVWFVPFILCGVLLAVFYISRRTDNSTESANVLNMLGIPALYASTFTLLIPNVQTMRESITLVAISWVAVLLDILIGGWGGAYTLIPLGALLLLVHRHSSHPPPQPELRTEIQT